MSNSLEEGLIEVGYFLSRLGISAPPKYLNSNKWNEAYNKFYSTFGENKSVEEFRNSLKNIRDHFDSHLENSREGWKNDDGSPQKLSAPLQTVFNSLEKLDNESLWDKIRPLATLSYNEKTTKAKNLQIEKNGARFFSSEFSGKKKVKNFDVKDAFVFHGLIVDALKSHVEKLHQDHLVFNTQKIDLALEKNGILTDVYEVKTQADTQSVYTAVGQLFMHTAGQINVQKYLVLPAQKEDRRELLSCLSELKIQVIWYKNNNKNITFEDV